MLVWMLVNVVLSGLALLFAVTNREAPHRLRFHVCMVALVGWLVPWSQLPAWMPDVLPVDLSRLERGLIAASAEATDFSLLVIDTRAVPLANAVTVLHWPALVFAFLLLAGVVLFIRALLVQRAQLRALLRTARDGNRLWQRAGIHSDVPVLLQTEISGAFSSGILKPRIWVHEAIAFTPEMPTLLQHELTHIEQHDNAWLLVITLVEKLFWWNPLVWLLSRQSRQLQELSCDERCRAHNAEYPVHLAALMLANAGLSPSCAVKPQLLSANIFNQPNLNIQRLKVLQRSHAMKPRHIASCIAMAVSAVVCVGLVTAQPEAPMLENRIIMVGPGAGMPAAGATMVWEGEAMPAPPDANKAVFFGMQAVDGLDQFIKVENINDETLVSFSFTDSPLPFVLGPLADFTGRPHLPSMGVAAGRPVAVVRTIEQATGGIESVQGDIVQAHVVEGGPVHMAVRHIGPAEPAELPHSPFLVIEDDSARERHVTVAGENMTIAAALDKIGEAANCNIFQQGNNVVVDWCGAQ